MLYVLIYLIYIYFCIQDLSGWTSFSYISGIIFYEYEMKSIINAHSHPRVPFYVIGMNFD